MDYAYLLGIAAMSMGHVIGYVLAMIAPEELQPGRRYFRLMKMVLLASLSGIAVLLFSSHVWVSILVVIAVFLMLLKVHIQRVIVLAFIYTGAVISSMISMQMFLMFAGTGLLYLMVETTQQILLLGEKKNLFAKDKELHIMLKKRMFVARRVFLVPGVMLLISIILLSLL